MLRRSFLSLLVSAPVAAAVAKVEAFAPSIVVPEASLVFDRALLGAQRIMPYILPLALDGGESDIIEAGRFARFVARPQLPFRPERLLIQGDRFEIYGVAANGEPQLDEVQPSELFAATRYGTRLQFHSMGPGQEIVMCVRNCGTEARRFVAMFAGAAMDHRPVFPLAEPSGNNGKPLELEQEWDDETDPELERDELA